MDTATAPRTDIHRPSAPEFDPQGYDLHDVYDTHPEEGDNRQRGEDVRRLVGEGFRFTSAHGSGQCGHCGAHIRYAALMLHRATMGMIYIGETCLDNRFDAGLTAGKFQRLRKAAKLNRERATKTARIAAIIAAHPTLEPLQHPDAAIAMGDFVADVMFKLASYGELSDRQIEAVERAVVRKAERDAEAAAKPAPKPVPVGKMTVTGAVVSTKAEHNPYSYGMLYKMLVEHTDGWRVWGSVPAGLADEDLHRGDLVTFDATVERSDRDEAFGFFKRPRNARRA